MHCDIGNTGQAMADKIKPSLETSSLDLSYLRGQSYNGASNMFGKCQGAAAII